MATALTRYGRRSVVRSVPLVKRAERKAADVPADDGDYGDPAGAYGNLTEFAAYVDPAAADQYRAAHLVYLAGKLEAVERGEITRLIIEIPVRHWKSSLASEKFIAWALGRNPKRHIIGVSYGADLAVQFSESIKVTIAGERYQAVFPGVATKDKSNRQDRWSLKGAFRATYRAAGMLGPITGQGADILMCDDVCADAEAVATEAQRDKIWRTYQSKLRPRLDPGAAIVVIMSRWHEDDLIGRLIAAEEEGGEKWDVVKLPALAQEDDPLGRQPGEPLWPDRYDLNELEVIRSTVGGAAWASLYQQSPRPDSGSVLDSGQLRRIERWDICLPGEQPQHGDAYKIIRMYRYWDLAFSERQGADFLAGVLCGEDAQKGFFVLDVVQFKGRWPVNKPKIVDVALKDGPGVRQLVECNGTQLGYAQDIKDDPRMRGRHVSGFSPDKAGNKETRASMWGSRVGDGIIYCVKAPWTALLTNQMDSFGAKGAHDDIVDGVSGCWAALHGISGPAFYSL